jgi:hypothetical protein
VYNAELELDLDQISIHTTENTRGWATVLNDIMENQRQHIQGRKALNMLPVLATRLNTIVYNVSF